MTSKELENILKSPITKGVKGRFISIEQLEQIKTIVEAWEVCKNDPVILDIIKTLVNGQSINWHRLSEEKKISIKKALEEQGE